MIVSAHPKGTQFARLARSLAVARGDPMGAEAFAQARGWTNVQLVCRALVNPSETADLESAMAPFAYDLAEWLRPRTITGRLQGMIRAPFLTRLLLQTTGGSGAWVSEGAPIPVSASGIEQTGTLDALKVGAITVLTVELLRNAVAGSDALIVNDAAASLVEALDRSFIDPSNAGVDGEMPAAVTRDTTTISSGGSSVATIDADLQSMVQVLIDGEMPLTTASWIFHPQTAVHLALMRGTSGAPAYPQITARGGSLLGMPVVTSTACSASGSPGERFAALVEASEILLADDGAASLELSTRAALQMDSAPSEAAAQVVSLWQSGLVGLKTTRTVNWHRRRAGAVAVLRDVAY